MSTLASELPGNQAEYEDAIDRPRLERGAIDLSVTGGGHDDNHDQTAAGDAAA